MKLFRKSALCLLLGVFAILPFVSACGETPNIEKEPTEEPTETQNPESETNPDPVVEKKEYTVSFTEETYMLALAESADTLTVSAVVYCNGETVEDAAPVYTSGDETVVSVSQTEGTLCAVSAGTARITASYEADGSVYAAYADVTVLASVTADAVNSYDETAVNLYGRTYYSSKRLVLDNVCTGIETAFAGTQLTLTVSGENTQKIRVFIDGETEGAEYIIGKSASYPVCENLVAGVHTARILKASSPQYGRVYLPASNAFSTDGVFLAAPSKSELKIEFIGDSITAGCGALGTSAQAEQSVENSDATKAYAYLAAQSLGADFSIMAQEGYCVKDGTYNMYNAYQQYSTYYNSAKFDVSSFDADIVVLALGENDMWHATSDAFSYTVDQFRQDYADMLRMIREYHPNAQIVCLYALMPASSTVQAMQTIQGAIEDTGDEQITYLQMMPNELGGNYHPNAATHASNAGKLVAHIQGLLA